MTTATFNGVALADAVPEALVVNVRRQILGSRRTVFTDVPGVAGAWQFGDKPGDRQLALSLHLLGDDFAQRRDAVRRLAQWADTTDPARLVLDDEDDRYELAILTSTPQPDELLVAATVDLEFRTSPYAYALDLSGYGWAATSGTAYSLTPPDDVEMYPVLEVHAAYGSVPGFTVDVDGRTFTYGTAIAAGDYVTVSSLAFVAYTGPNVDLEAVGAFDPETVSMGAVDGVFPVLYPGTNSVTVTTGNGAQLSVHFAWRRRYR